MGGFSGLYDIVNLLGTFSLTKAHLKLGKLNCVQLQVTLHQAKFSASYKRDLTLERQSLSSSAELDQQALPAGHPLPFEKEAKLHFIKTRCREVESQAPHLTNA